MLKNTPNFEILVMLISMIVLLVFPLQGLVPIVSYSQIRDLSTVSEEQQQRPQTQTSEITQGTSGDGTGLNDYANNNVVIITFGDGYKSQYLYAKPILDKYGFKANFFVTCNKVGLRDKITWQELVQLYKEGHVIGSLI